LTPADAIANLNSSRIFSVFTAHLLCRQGQPGPATAQTSIGCPNRCTCRRSSPDLRPVRHGACGPRTVCVRAPPAYPHLSQAALRAAGWRRALSLKGAPAASPSLQVTATGRCARQVGLVEGWLPPAPALPELPAHQGRPLACAR